MVLSYSLIAIPQIHSSQLNFKQKTTNNNMAVLTTTGNHIPIAKSPPPRHPFTSCLFTDKKRSYMWEIPVTIIKHLSPHYYIILLRNSKDLAKTQQVYIYEVNQEGYCLNCVSTEYKFNRKVPLYQEITLGGESSPVGPIYLQHAHNHINVQLVYYPNIHHQHAISF